MLLYAYTPECDDEGCVLATRRQEDNEEDDDQEWDEVVAAVVTLAREGRVPGVDKVLVDALTR